MYSSPPVKPGVYRDVPFETYCKIPALNASTAVHGLRSIAHLKGAIDGLITVDKSDAIQLGTIVHALAEGQDVDSVYSVLPDFAKDEQNVDKKGNRSYSASSTWCKNKTDAFRAESAGEVVKQDVYDSAKRSFQSLANHSVAKQWIQNAWKEVTVISMVNGVLCKARIDLLRSDEFADIKTCPNSDSKPFGKHACNLNYPFRMAFYTKVLSHFYGVQSCTLIAVETSGIHAVKCYEMTASVLEQWQSDVEEIIESYGQALQDNDWDSPAITEPLHVPQFIESYQEEKEMERIFAE